MLLLKQGKGSDASAESGSEVEDVTSPTAPKTLITNPSLTPVHEEASIYHMLSVQSRNLALSAVQHSLHQ